MRLLSGWPKGAWPKAAWPRRRSLILALPLILWPWPLDDDRLPTPGPSRSAAGTPDGRPKAGESPAGAQAEAAFAMRPGAGNVSSNGATFSGPGAARAGDAAPAGPTGGAEAGEPQSARPASTRSASAGSAPVAPGDPAVLAGSSAVGAGAGPETAGPSACLPPETRRLVYMLDVSVSMGLPYEITPAIEDELDAAVDRGDAVALARYWVLLSSAELSRLKLAKQAFAQTLDRTPDGVGVGLVSFHGCQDIRSFGPVERPGFSILLEGVRGLMWHRGGETALSASLAKAYAMIGDIPGRIVVITDGKDTCGPPPCEAVARLSAAQPRVRVDVVDVSGRSDAACLASATGGTVRFAPLSGATGDLGEALRQLGRACRPGDRP